MTDETGAKGAWSFDGAKAVVVAAATRRILVATVAVEGPGHITDESGTRLLRADLDDDGTAESVTCTIWSRWGSLLCTLPLPDKTTQSLSIGCNRFGVLASTTHGRHDLVCNDDIVLRFDGKHWVEPAE